MNTITLTGKTGVLTTRDLYEEYKESPDSETMNMTQYGCKQVEKYANMCRRGLITKKEYTAMYKLIEKQLFRI